jgi:hypothetical protein
MPLLWSDTRLPSACHARGTPSGCTLARHALPETDWFGLIQETTIDGAARTRGGFR